MIFKNIIRSRHFERTGVSVTGLRSLSTFAIGFLLTGIFLPVFQMVGRSWMMDRRLYMGDSREVPHVNIVRKLRHSCEDVNFASSIYSNTLKQFNFIVDYCLRLHIMYKHSQTHSEHFL